MRVDLQSAIELRKEGFTYEEIAFRLGCSKAWCAKHLNGVLKGCISPENLSKQELREEAVKILEKALTEVKALK